MSAARVYCQSNVSRNLTIPTSYIFTGGVHTGMGFALDDDCGCYGVDSKMCTAVLINKDHTYMWFSIYSGSASINIDPLCVAITNM